jgi:hypothetical protein
MLLVQIYLARDAGYQATNAYYSNFLVFKLDKSYKSLCSNFFGKLVLVLQLLINQISWVNKLGLEQQMVLAQNTGVSWCWCN